MTRAAWKLQAQIKQCPHTVVEYMAVKSPEGVQRARQCTRCGNTGLDLGPGVERLDLAEAIGRAFEERN